MHQTIHIGCSGYYYSYWKNRFYPKGLQPKDWLQYYSSVFNTVELNGTFYRVPDVHTLKKYISLTPADFRFSVKVSRYITHVQKLKGSRQQVSDFTGLIREGLGEKLSCFLFQLPPSFHYNEENLNRVLTTLEHNEQFVVEFRHPSWWNKTVSSQLAKTGITFCNIDYPGFATPIISTGKLFYYRFHGNPELFKSPYSTRQLTEFCKTIPKDTRQLYIYFNNTYYEAGYSNAATLREIIDLQR